jgi:hypothetical protein
MYWGVCLLRVPNDCSTVYIRRELVHILRDRNFRSKIRNIGWYDRPFFITAVTRYGRPKP